MKHANLAIGARVHVGADVLNAYLIWRRQTPVTVGQPGTIVARLTKSVWLVKLDTALPVGTDGPAKVLRQSVTARGTQLTRI